MRCDVTKSPNASPSLVATTHFLFALLCFWKAALCDVTEGLWYPSQVGDIALTLFLSPSNLHLVAVLCEMDIVWHLFNDSGHLIWPPIDPGAKW